jgi:CheY-like chemotaxis protein
LPTTHKLPAPRGKALVESAPLTTARNLTVLVVDDDPLVLTNMSAMLADLGHRAFEAASAREALDILRRENSIELVMTDHAMPRMTGFQLIEQIQKGWPHLPVILATGFAELPPGLDARGAGHISQSDHIRRVLLEEALGASGRGWAIGFPAASIARMWLCGRLLPTSFRKR